MRMRSILGSRIQLALPIEDPVAKACQSKGNAARRSKMKALAR